MNPVRSGRQGSASCEAGADLSAGLLVRLRRLGPECLSQLAVEFAISNKQLLAVLLDLELQGLVSRRTHEDSDVVYKDDEVRWGLATLRHPAEPGKRV